MVRFWTVFAVVLLCGVGIARAQEQTPIDKAFQSAQLAAAPGSGAALAEGAARVAASDPALRDALDRSRSAEQERRALETVLAGLRAQGEPAAARARGVAADLDKAAVAAQDARSALEAAYPRFVALTDPEPLSVAQVQGLLSPGDALVMILPAERGTYVWAITPTTAFWTRSDMNASEVGTASETLLRSLRVTDGRGAVDASRPGRGSAAGFDRALAWRLYQALWAPMEAVLAQANTVYLVVDGPLRAVPLGVLVTAQPFGDDSDPAVLRATPWLQRRHAFALLPAVSSLRTVQTTPPKPRRGFAGFGDALTQNYADGSAAKALAPLPETRRELLTLSRSLKAGRRSVHLGAQATEQALKTADLEAVSVLALATHAVSAVSTDEVSRPEAALIFTPPVRANGEDDGFLTVSEAAQLKLGADLVILSACDTASDDPNAVGINSLSRAFFHAGARSLMVSNWRIRDDTAARLSTGAIDIAVRRRIGLAQALQQASLGMLDDRSKPLFAHPAQWASFSLLGNGTAGF